MTRKIVKTFIYQGSGEVPEVLYPRTDGRWASFQNGYAVWPTNGTEVTTYTIIRKFTAPYTGTYYFRSTVDNSATIYVDGVAIGGTANFNQNPSRVAVTLASGERQLKFVVSNAGDVAGFALTISNSSDSIIWDTRTYATPVSSKTSSYTVTMPFKAHITAKLWGAGGGGGGMDAGSYGGSGAPGLYNVYSFDVEIGDVLEVSVGSAGLGGSSNSGSAPGGRGGDARVNLDGTPQLSFNGGKGTAAGPSPYSGGGGGGGGATIVLKNGIPVVVAGGGAGGGGGGNDGNGAGQTTRRTATIANNANGLSVTDYRGENGQLKGGDGGGAGGGGGGYPGGQGGAVAGGDASGFCGQCGGNFPVRTPLPGEITSYNGVTYSLGGQAGGGNGAAGIAILEIEPISLLAVKTSGAWASIGTAYAKISGAWRPVEAIYTKVYGNWKQVNGVGDKTGVEFSGSGTNYGSVDRPFS